MANRRRKKKRSTSFFGIVLFEVIAVAVFFFLYNNAKAERDADFLRNQAESVENGLMDHQWIASSTAGQDSYQMHVNNPLQELLGQQPAGNYSAESTNESKWWRR